MLAIPDRPGRRIKLLVRRPIPALASPDSPWAVETESETAGQRVFGIDNKVDFPASTLAG
jgi:hypothetical protein